MRIGFFVYEFPPRKVGGLGTYAEYMTQQMIKLGHDVTVFTMNDIKGTLKTRDLRKGVEIHAPIPIDVSPIFPAFVIDDIKKWGPRSNFFYEIFIYNILSAAKFLNDLIRSQGYEFDIICAHDWLSVIAGIIIKRATNLPFVFHIHSTEQGRTMGDGSSFIRHLEKTGGRSADKVMTVSFAMQEALINQEDFDPNKTRFCYNGIDLEKYNPDKVSYEEKMTIRDKYGIKPEEKMILFVGRLALVKGIGNLVQAMPMVTSEYPDARLVIVGKGGLEQVISSMINYLGLKDRVKTRFEFLREEETIAHYAACDMAVFPSTYEPFGIVALEAMAMEKPVVVGASGISGLREIVIPSGPDQVGMHVNGNNSTDIAYNGINLLLADPDRAKEMGKKGRKRAEEFTWERTAKSTVEIYEEAISQNK